MGLIRYVITYVKPRWRWLGYRRGSRHTFDLITEALRQYWYDRCVSRLERGRGTRTSYRSGWPEIGPYETETEVWDALSPLATCIAVEQRTDGWYIQYIVTSSTTLKPEVK